jgi:hypothetical protein
MGATTSTLPIDKVESKIIKTTEQNDIQKMQNQFTDDTRNISAKEFNLSEKILLAFQEDPNEAEDQMILFPHDTQSKLDKFTENYKKLEKEKNELDKLIMEKQTKAIDSLKKRVGLTKKQVAKMIIKADDKNTDHLTRVRKLTDNLEEMKNKFKGLITDYSPKGPIDLDEVKTKWKQEQVDAAEHIKTVAKAARTATPTTKIEIQSVKTGGKKVEFKKDPLDYIFENHDLTKIAKLWNIKYSKNVLNDLKIAFKYKNGAELDNKEWKQLVTSLNIDTNKNSLNRPKTVKIVRKKLINVPKI